ncbi:hypothetical protein NFI96_023443 [Prochilodus magdalenae]|nr:hypothetical protein NFI96_023443 [Prochilodus magdalenae]
MWSDCRAYFNIVPALPDTTRALGLLEDYCSKLKNPEEQQLKAAIQRVVGIFRSSLFQALIALFTVLLDFVVLQLQTVVHLFPCNTFLILFTLFVNGQDPHGTTTEQWKMLPSCGKQRECHHVGNFLLFHFYFNFEFSEYSVRVISCLSLCIYTNLAQYGSNTCQEAVSAARVHATKDLLVLTVRKALHRPLMQNLAGGEAT